MSIEKALDEILLDVHRAAIKEIKLKKEDALAILERVTFLEQFAANLIKDAHARGTDIGMLVPSRRHPHRG